MALRHNDHMAEDEIERLLREINGANGQPAGQSGESAPARPDQAGPGGGRVAFAGVAAIAMGGGAFIFGLVTPFTDALDMGLAGSVTAFITGLVAGPPRWFSS